MTPPLQLYLIRHGETAWSLSGQHTGRTDIALTANGEQMARQLAPSLAQITFTRVFSSPRQRARSTCELAGLGATAEVDEDLAEWDYGDYEGLRSRDIRATRPGWDIWRDGCPGGESPAEIAARADRFIARLGPLGGAVAVFAHGHFGRVLTARWIGLAIAEGQHFALAPARLSILGYDADHPGVRVVSLWNAEPAPTRDA